MADALTANTIVKYLKKPIELALNANPKMLDGAQLVHLNSDQILFTQGESAESCFLVLTGSIKITKKTEKSEIVLTIISEGDIGGALLMNNDSTGQYPGNVIALTRASILRIPRATYLEQWANNQVVADFLNECIRKRVLDLQQDKQLQATTVETRVVHFIQRHYLERKDLLAKKVTRKLIAQSIGAKTETVIRILKKLERSGSIRTKSSIISVLDEAFFTNWSSHEDRN